MTEVLTPSQPLTIEELWRTVEAGLSPDDLAAALAIAALRGQYNEKTHENAELERENTELKTKNMELEIKTRTDYLTGLPNRAAFEHDLKKLAAPVQLRRKEEPSISARRLLLIGDLDGFKIINDAQSHHQGDRTLKIIGALLRSAIRKEDEVYRLGGDEFAILAEVSPNTSVKHMGRLIVERFMHNQRMLISPSVGSNPLPNGMHLTREDIESLRVIGFSSAVAAIPPGSNVEQLLSFSATVVEAMKVRKAEKTSYR